MADQLDVRLGSVLALLLWLATPSVFAQQPPPVPAGPLTLDQVLELAQSRSEAIGIAQASVERAKGTQVQARSGRLPHLTASPATNGHSHRSSQVSSAARRRVLRVRRSLSIRPRP